MGGGCVGGGTVGLAVGGMPVWVGVADLLGGTVLAMVGGMLAEVVSVTGPAGAWKRVVTRKRQEAARRAAMTNPATKGRTRAEMGNAFSRLGHGPLVQNGVATFADGDEQAHLAQAIGHLLGQPAGS